MFLRGQATLYHVGLQLFNHNMLPFHSIHPDNVASPIYTRLFCIDSAQKHLADYTWDLFDIFFVWGMITDESTRIIDGVALPLLLTSLSESSPVAIEVAKLENPTPSLETQLPMIPNS